MEETELEQLLEKIKTAEGQIEVFAIVKLLLDTLSVDGLDPEDNWLSIAYRLEQYGHTELAEILKVANTRCFQLSLKEL